MQQQKNYDSKDITIQITIQNRMESGELQITSITLTDERTYERASKEDEAFPYAG